MDRPHAHHIVMRNGPEGSQDAIRESKAILTRHGIDWYAGVENLIWAPNLGPKNHTVEYAEAVRAALKQADPNGRDAVVEALRRMGEAFKRGDFNK
jgi:hypothetical protein